MPNHGPNIYRIPQRPDSFDTYLNHIARHHGTNALGSARGDQIAGMQRHGFGDVAHNHVQREDEFLCKRVQRGLASSSYQPGPLSTLEHCMLEFHDLLRERIPEVRQPSAPAHFA